MLFNSWSFVLVFVVVAALYHTLRWRALNVLLLLASYVFYAFWD